jgi:hypothetical protein
MTTPIDQYPLTWPPTWPREQHPRSAPFGPKTIASALYGLKDELRKLGATNVVISSNAELLRNGGIASRQRYLDDTGVAVWFRLNGKDHCIPCDRWNRLQDNIHAITLSIGAIRGLSRWGADQWVDAAFAGFGALPAEAGSGTPWWVVLGVDRTAPKDAITMAYRRLAKQRHPDAGGTDEAFVELQRAYEQAVAS